MKNKTVLFAIISFIIVFFLIGCTSTMSLYYAKPPNIELNRGKINVIIDDQRPAEEGRNDPTRVGTIRNTFGMPFALRSRSDREPTQVVNKLVSDCLRAAGYEVKEGEANVPQLRVTLKSFWSDGYQHSRMWIVMAAQLKKNMNSQPVWENEFETNVGITWTVGYSKFDQGFNDMLEDAKQQLITRFEDPKFHNSYQSLKMRQKKSETPG